MSGSGYTRREEIARIIAPNPWDAYDACVAAGQEQHPDKSFLIKPSLAKADAILALPPLSAASELVGALEDALFALESAKAFILKRSGTTNPFREDTITRVQGALAALKALPCGGDFSAVGRERLDP